MEWAYNCTEKAVNVSEIKKGSANAVTWLNEKIEHEKQRLTETSRAAQLWVQYMEYVKVINMLIFVYLNKKNVQFICSYRPLSLC